MLGVDQFQNYLTYCGFETNLIRKWYDVADQHGSTSSHSKTVGVMIRW